MATFRLQLPAIFRWLIWATTVCFLWAAGHSAAVSSDRSRPGDDIAIYHLKPDERGEAVWMTLEN
jgi:hypothetical protein